MPGEIIDRPNPGPLRSQLPDSVQELAVKLSKTALDEKDHAAIKKFRRAATYIAAAMIFLKDNAYYERDLKFDDIKPRLLGKLSSSNNSIRRQANETKDTGEHVPDLFLYMPT